jgi:hypothetical protein
MSNSLKEMVSGIQDQNESLSHTKSKGDDDEASGDEEEKPKKKEPKKKAGLQTCDEPLAKIEEIEGQINMIVEIIPQIKDVGRKTGLIKSVAPVLEEAMTELVKQMNTSASLKGKIKKATKQKEKLEDDSDDDKGTVSDAKKSLKKVKKLIGEDDEPKKKKKSKKGKDDEEEPEGEEKVKTVTKSAAKPLKNLEMAPKPNESEEEE